MPRQGGRVQVVQKPADLPARKGYYLRLRSDPTLLQHSQVGDLFQQRSGNTWAAAGYVWREDAAGRKTLDKLQEKI